jgi:hypothetical protein
MSWIPVSWGIPFLIFCNIIAAALLRHGCMMHQRLNYFFWPCTAAGSSLYGNAQVTE